MSEIKDDIIQINSDNTERDVHFVFGRFQPPTIGHGALVQSVSEKAGRGDAYVFVSSTQDAKKNPLTVLQKIKWLKQMFGERYSNVKFINTTICPIINKVTTTGCKNPIVAIYALKEAGYEKASFYAGSDRAIDYEKTVKKCNFEGIELEVKTVGKERELEPSIIGKKRDFTEEIIERCPPKLAMVIEPEEETDIAGVSGTKMRNFAVACNATEFSKGVVNLSADDIKELMGEIRTGLKLPECPVMTGGKRKKQTRKRNNRNKRRNTRKR